MKCVDPNPYYQRWLCQGILLTERFPKFGIKSWPYFPRLRKINAIFPVPKTPGRASSILNFRFSLNKIRRLYS